MFRDLLAILVETIPNVLFSSRLFPDWISILAGVSVDLAARVCFSLCAHVVVSLCFVYVCVGPVWHLTPFQIMQENISSQKTYKYLSAVMLFCPICAVTMVDAHSVLYNEVRMFKSNPVSRGAFRLL